MTGLQITSNTFDPITHWCNSINPTDIINSDYCVHLFDQNGYHLTPIEQLYAEVNGYPLNIRRHETVLRKPWIVSDVTLNGAHINHSDLFERKGYSGSALKQLVSWASDNKLLWKIIKMKPKWGIDISIDYVDDLGNVFEVFHYEWDSFDYDAIVAQKYFIEQFVLSQDWNLRAVEILQRKNEWIDLDFFGQSKWRTDYYNIPPEKFKHIIWEIDND